MPAHCPKRSPERYLGYVAASGSRLCAQSQRHTPALLGNLLEGLSAMQGGRDNPVDLWVGDRGPNVVDV